MRKLILFVASTAIVLCSCSTMQTVSYKECRTVEPTQRMCAVPLTADLQVSDARIEYSERVSLNLSKKSAPELKSIIDELKSSVLFHAIKRYNADVMIAPIIDVQNKAENVLVITVTGYPATYKNIRNATKDDSWFIPVMEPAKNEAPAPSANGFKLFGK